MTTENTPTAYLDWSVNVDCPSCKESIDLTESDDDAVIASAVFNNQWDRLKGYEVTCGHCQHEFTLAKVTC